MKVSWCSVKDGGWIRAFTLKRRRPVQHSRVDRESWRSPAAGVCRDTRACPWRAPPASFAPNHTRPLPRHSAGCRSRSYLPALASQCPPPCTPPRCLCTLICTRAPPASLAGLTTALQERNDILTETLILELYAYYWSITYTMHIFTHWGSKSCFLSRALWLRQRNVEKLVQATAE